MSLSATVDDVLKSHVTLEVESIDRMYLNMFVPQLQIVGNAVNFFRKHRGQTMVTMKMMSSMTVAYREAVDQYVLRHDIPVIHFEKDQRKDDVMKAELQKFCGKEGVVFVGVAQAVQQEVAGLLQGALGFVEEAEQDVEAVVDGVVTGLDDLAVDGDAARCGVHGDGVDGVLDAEVAEPGVFDGGHLHGVKVGLVEVVAVGELVRDRRVTREEDDLLRHLLR